MKWKRFPRPRAYLPRPARPAPRGAQSRARLPAGCTRPRGPAPSGADPAPRTRDGQAQLAVHPHRGGEEPACQGHVSAAGGGGPNFLGRGRCPFLKPHLSRVHTARPQVQQRRGGGECGRRGGLEGKWGQICCERGAGVGRGDKEGPWTGEGTRVCKGPELAGSSRTALKNGRGFNRTGAERGGHLAGRCLRELRGCGWKGWGCPRETRGLPR